MMDTEGNRRDFLASWLTHATGRTFWSSDSDVDLLLAETASMNPKTVLVEWLLERQICDEHQARELASTAEDVFDWNGWSR